MTPKRLSRPDPKPAITPADPRALVETLRQACRIFFFSFVFAVLFDLVFSYGIELRVKPSIIRGFKPAAAPHLAFTGWNTPSPPKKKTNPFPTPTPVPVSEDDFIRIGLEGAKDRFDQKSAVFLDARPPEEYQEGHIPGALEFYADDFDKYAPQVLPGLPDRSQEIVCYCHGSSCELSITLAHRLKDIGYTNVKVFFGGWPQWQKAGYPIAKGEAP